MISIPSWRLPVTFAVASVVLQVAAQAQDGSAATETVQNRPASVAVPAFELPFSEFASPEARETFATRVLVPGPQLGSDIAKVRVQNDINDNDRVKRMRALFPVSIERRLIAGVSVQIVSPAGRKADPTRILINLHGGGFLWGSGPGALVESIPIAAQSGMTVVAIDYRMAPEARWPAASEDVAKVYRALLANHAASGIGIYGCSAGAMLTGQSVVWFQRHNLPRPGAIGMFCMGATMPGGDSSWLSQAATASKLGPIVDFRVHPYFAGANFDDPAVRPSASAAVLARFPPTLLISGTRDGALSSVLATQSMLTRAGVEAELHVWDGMWHSFMSDPEPRESREAYAVVARFFQKHLLARKSARRIKTEGR